MLRRLGLYQVAHAFLVAPEALVPQHQAHAALQLGVFLTAVAAVFAQVAGTVGLAEFHRPETLVDLAGAPCAESAEVARGILGHHIPVSHLQGGAFHKNRASELRKRGQPGAATAATTLYLT